MRCMPSSVSRTARLPCSAASSARRAASALASALFDTCFIDTVSSSTADEVFVISWSCCVAPAVMSSAASRIWLALLLTSMAALRTRSRTLVKLSSMKFTESTTLPSASLVTLPRIVRSPRATWLIVLRRSVMLRCSDSCACWFVTACATFGGAAISILGDETEFVARCHLHARADVTRRQALRESAELAHGLEHAPGEYQNQRDRARPAPARSRREAPRPLAPPGTDEPSRSASPPHSSRRDTRVPQHPE